MLHALGKTIILKPYREEKSSAILTVSDDRPTELGTVLSVGNDVTLVKPKQIVMFPRWAYEEFKKGDEKVYVIQEKEILARYEDTTSGHSK